MPKADTPSRSLFPRLQRAIFPDMVSNFEVEYIAGGATQNSARVAQWMLGEAGSVTYIGCVGKDEFAAVKDQLKKFVAKNSQKSQYPRGGCS